MREQFKSRLSSTLSNFYLAAITLFVKAVVSPHLSSMFRQVFTVRVVSSKAFIPIFSLIEVIISLILSLLFICLVDSMRSWFSTAKLKITFLNDNNKSIKEKTIIIPISASQLVNDFVSFKVEISIPGKITHKIFNILKVVSVISFVPEHFQFVVADDSPTMEGEKFFEVDNQSAIIIPWTASKLPLRNTRQFSAKLKLAIIPTGVFQSEVNLKISSNLTKFIFVNNFIGQVVKIVFGKQILGRNGQFYIEVERK